MSDERKRIENQSLEPAAQVPRPMARMVHIEPKVSDNVQTFCIPRSRRGNRRRADVLARVHRRADDLAAARLGRRPFGPPGGAEAVQVDRQRGPDPRSSEEGL